MNHGKIRGGIGILFFAALAAQAAGQPLSDDSTILNDSTRVLREIMNIPVKSIPQSMLFDAQAILVIPDMLKGGFIVGIKRGHGVFTVREDNGAWQVPTFVTMTGGSFGWQAGIQSADVILVFKTRKSVANLMKGKFTLGADASLAAGPLGRDAMIGTDGKLQSEVYSYSQARGLFIGAAIDGAVLEIDQKTTSRYYNVPTQPGAPAALPLPAAQFLEEIVKHTTPPPGQKVPAPTITSTPVTSTVPGALPTAAVPADAETVRRQLADAGRRLDSLLDASWKSYLALPAEIYGPNPPAGLEGVNQSLARYNAILNNAQYRALTDRPEFKTAHELLQRYVNIRTLAPSGPVNLPPPPK